MARPRWFLVLAATWACLPGGCAALSKRPPTPAAALSPREEVAAAPGERYFVLIFGSQSTPLRPKYTHSWGTIVKVTSRDGREPTIEEQTISWLPMNLNVRPWSLHVEPGTNFGLHFTIEEMLRNDERVSVWGPYEVRPELARRFAVQKAFMESGRVGYQAVDTVGEAARTGDGCNCIHSMTDMDPLFDRRQYPLTYFGESASNNIVRQLHERPLIVCPGADHSWLLPLLGLDKYPLCRRGYSGTIVPYSPENQERYLQRAGK